LFEIQLEAPVTWSRLIFLLTAGDSPTVAATSSSLTFHHKDIRTELTFANDILKTSERKNRLLCQVVMTMEIFGDIVLRREIQ
jgi:hypothetical protein